MKKKILLSLSAFTFFSVELLAIDGKHNGLSISSVNGGDICVYCHTPHAANKGPTGPTPIWNKGTSPTDFDMYGTTLAGTETAAQPTNQSLACLSCHDGVSAMNAVVNAPGSGFQGRFAVNPLDASTYLLNGNGGITTDVMGFGDLGGGATKAIGVDGFTNDHPISIKYNVGRGSLKPTETVLTGWLGATKVADLLRGPNRDTVECASCHDPHNNHNSLYRRFDNSNGSGLCFGCHDK